MHSVYGFSKFILRNKNRVLSSTRVRLRPSVNSRWNSTSNKISNATRERREHPIRRYFRIFSYSAFGTIGAVGCVGLIKFRILNTAELEECILKEPPPEYVLSEKVQNSSDKTGLKLTLYQSQTCPSCAKVRAYLDYFGFCYNIVEVNYTTHQQTFWSSYKKIPFLLVQDDSECILQLKGSVLIISILQSLLTNPGMSVYEAFKGYPVTDYHVEDDERGLFHFFTHCDKMYFNAYFLMNYTLPKDRTKEDMVLERKWRRWVDTVFADMIERNIYVTAKETKQSMEWFYETGHWEVAFSWYQRCLLYFGAALMYLYTKRDRLRHKAEARRSLYEECSLWASNVSKVGGRFMGGNEPNLADLAVYGMLRNIEGCESFTDVFNNTMMATWYNRMKESVELHKGAKRLTERGKIILKTDHGC